MSRCPCVPNNAWIESLVRVCGTDAAPRVVSSERRPSLIAAQRGLDFYRPGAVYRVERCDPSARRAMGGRAHTLLQTRNPAVPILIRQRPFTTRASGTRSWPIWKAGRGPSRSMTITTNNSWSTSCINHERRFLELSTHAQDRRGPPERQVLYRHRGARKRPGY